MCPAGKATSQKKDRVISDIRKQRTKSSRPASGPSAYHARMRRRVEGCASRTVPALRTVERVKARAVMVPLFL